jgi:hypothetical protein
MAIKLKEIVPWGRSFDEYRRIFQLSPHDLAGRILGCADGPASFNAEATALGHRVTSCDPLYAFSNSEIEQRVYACKSDMIAQVRSQFDGFCWTDFRDPDHLGECRLAAMRSFLDDFDLGREQGRYIVASLPTLPFENNQFDLALVSHLLFLYSEQLDYEFHRAAVGELLRVGMEVRIFPLLTLGRKISPHVDSICRMCVQAGLRAEKCRVPYEFQRGGNEMLRIIRSQA